MPNTVSLSTAAEGLQRLIALLPLRQRLDALSPEARRIYQATLRSFAESGRPLNPQETTALLSGASQVFLSELNDADLVVLNKSADAVAGAYPFADGVTTHTVGINGHAVHAMCALDALVIAPMFRTEARITSRCAQTDDMVTIDQHGMEVLNVNPSEDVLVGIRWQTPGGHSAHSLCREMVFLRDAEAAGAWGEKRSDCSFYELSEALVFAEGFFLPLLEVGLQTYEEGSD